MYCHSCGARKHPLQLGERPRAVIKALTTVVVCVCVWHFNYYVSPCHFCSRCLQNKDTYEPFCKVPLVTSSKEEQRLITTSNKVDYRHGNVANDKH